MKTTFKSRTYYEPAPYHGLCVNLLKQLKVDVSKKIYERMWNFIHKYGTIICSNSWDHVGQHPLFNIIIVF
jgi:hypothetical protein